MRRWRNTTAKILQVGWRDFRFTALTPAFLIAVIGVPILLGIAGLIIYPILLTQETSTLEGRLVVVDETGDVPGLVEAVLERGLRNEVAEEMARAISKLPGSNLTGTEGLGFMNVPTEIEVVAVRNPARTDELKQGLRDGEYLAIAVLPPELLQVPPNDPGEHYEEPSMVLFTSPESSPQHVATLEQILQEAVTESRALNAGYDYGEIRRILETPLLEVLRITASGEEGRPPAVRQAIMSVVVLL